MNVFPDNEVHVTNMGLTWVLSATGGPHAGPMSFAVRVVTAVMSVTNFVAAIISVIKWPQTNKENTGTAAMLLCYKWTTPLSDRNVSGVNIVALRPDASPKLIPWTFITIFE